MSAVVANVALPVALPKSIWDDPDTKVGFPVISINSTAAAESALEADVENEDEISVTTVTDELTAYDDEILVNA